MNLRQQKLRIIQQVHQQWWSENFEIEPGGLGSEESERNLLNRIEISLHNVDVALNNSQVNKGVFGGR